MNTPTLNNLHQIAQNNGSYIVEAQEEPKPVQNVRKEAPHTGTYGAALIATSSSVPVIASFISVVLFIAFPQSLWPRLFAPLCGTAITLLAWFILAVPFIRYTAVDRSNAARYDLLLSRFVN